VKVFISYSTTDTWIARKICEDLGRIGVEVFLDSKDIESGDDVEEAVRQHLVTSDELLLLVSSASLSSHWVMMEVGAARTLGKRLVPVLINVSPNELPQPFNRHLARDLNQIERYYAEITERSRSTTELPPERLLLPPPTSQPHAPPLTPGVQVRITAKPLEPNDFPVFSEDMRPYLGERATIRDYGWEEQGTPTFRLDIDDGVWLWADRWLSRSDPSG